MSFAAPLAFAMSALMLPVVVLYILKVKRRRVPVAYLRLWEQLLVETRARSLFQRLKRLYSLLLQLLILATIVMALSQPALELSSVKKESIVLLLDTSASMRTVEDAETGQRRFDAMMERASEIVEGRSFEDEMMIVAASDRVDVLTAFNRNTLRLREALERVGPTHRTLDHERAYDFAREVTADRENPVILFLSDGAAGGVRRTIEGDENAHVVPIGEAKENIGIVRFSARKNTSLGTDYLLGVVKNFGEESAEFDLELAINGSTQQVVPKVLGPGEELQEAWQYQLDEGATLTLTLTREGEAFTIDDTAWAVVRPSRLRRVVLVAPTREVAYPFWIAFESMSEVISADSITTTPESYAQLSAEEKRADVTICVDTVPDDVPGQGNLILMNTPLPDWLPATQKGVDPEPVVWDWDREHLLNRYLNYRDLPIPPARVIETDVGAALVSSFEGPLISAYELADRMVVYVSFDMTAKLFPFRLAFPMLLRNSIAWFEVEEDLVLEGNYAPGETIQPLRRIRDETASATFLRDEEWITRDLAVRDGKFYFNETEEPGGYLFRISGTNFPTAVNLFDPDESTIAPDVPPEGGDGLYAEEGRHLLNRDLWTLLGILGLILWALEWAFYHRRVTE